MQVQELWSVQLLKWVSACELARRLLYLLLRLAQDSSQAQVMDWLHRQIAIVKPEAMSV